MRHRPLLAALPLLLIAGTAAAQQPPPGPGGRFRQRQAQPAPAPTPDPAAPAAAPVDGDAPAAATPTAPGDTTAPTAPADAAKPGDPQDPARAEPTPQAPPNPLAVSPDVAARIGSDLAEPPPPPPVGATTHKYFPYYEERKGDYRFRLLPPLYLEHTRGLPTSTAGATTTGTASQEDRESLIAVAYYNRRSPKVDADVVFPLFWRVRDDDSHLLVVGPFVHRQAPGENDNWLAPLYFQGERKDGGYFHMPALLTTSHWNQTGAFTLVGPYFRTRTNANVDLGIAPLFFHGDNGDTDGAHKTYTLIPPLLFYTRSREIDENRLTIIGPIVSETNLKRRIFDVAPFFFHIEGRPEALGKRESHTTLFPFFHYGHTDDVSLFIVPGYLRRMTKTADTMLTPFYSHAETRNGATSFTVAGPILPLFFKYSDKDTGASSLTILPLFSYGHSPIGRSILTPLYGRWDTYGISRSHWVFPTFTLSNDLDGWEADMHPLIYLGRSGTSSHTVIAPFFWDFANPTGRTTIGFPVYWRFADTQKDSVTQVAANTVYLQKRVSGGLDWQFHIVPFFSYGENPSGYFWNVLFGLAGYERAGATAKVKAFWIPIQVAGGSGSGPSKNAAWAN